jgi:uncharacterized protein
MLGDIITYIGVFKMIINFSVENWRSFQEKASFTMIATREKQHNERIPYINKYRARILPTAAIYGGNASGKTNFFQAMRFVKKMVLEGTGVQPDKLISVEPFRLNPEMKDKPCRFTIEILVDEIIYELIFAVTKQAVIEERLTKITSSNETVLYDRTGEEVNFHETLESNQALNYAFKGTRDNQLFLTNSVSQKNNEFLPVYRWFKESLVMVAPDARFGNYSLFIDEDNPLYTDMINLLPLFDMGIVSLSGKELPVENLPVPKKIINDFKEEFQEGKRGAVSFFLNHYWFIVSQKDGELTARKLVTKHIDVFGNEVEFEMQHESDGSRRVIDLLPAFLDASAKDSKKVYMIDELDRSLHTILSRKLIDFYLASCSSNSRSQLILSTHDLLLMDQDIFRRDEMWVTERNTNGSSNLFSFSEYKELRNDKDLRKSYLQGRLGGIPKILLEDRDAGFLEVN